MPLFFVAMRCRQAFAALLLFAPCAMSATAQTDSVRPTAVARFLVERLEEPMRARLEGDTSWRSGRLSWVGTTGFELATRRTLHRISFDSLASLQLDNAARHRVVRGALMLAAGLGGGVIVTRHNAKAIRRTGVGAPIAGALVFGGGFFAGVLSTAAAGALWIATHRWHEVDLKSLR